MLRMPPRTLSSVRLKKSNFAERWQGLRRHAKYIAAAVSSRNYLRRLDWLDPPGTRLCIAASILSARFSK